MSNATSDNISVVPSLASPAMEQTPSGSIPESPVLLTGHSLRRSMESYRVTRAQLADALVRKHGWGSISSWAEVLVIVERDGLQLSQEAYAMLLEMVREIAGERAEGAK